jgi:hypothetical protein
MISGNWMNDSVHVDGHRSSSPSNPTQFAGAIRHLMPRTRDREVPYSTKGGEQHGHKEESSEED